MNDQDRATLTDRDASPEQIRQTWEVAAIRAMYAHAEADVPVTIWDWENNRPVQAPAADVLARQDELIPQPRPADPADQDSPRRSA